MNRFAIFVVVAAPLWGQPPHLGSQSKPEVTRHSAGPGDPHKPENRPGRIPYLDYQNGFIGMKFGSPFEKFEGLSLLEDFGELKLYERENDIKQLGLATVESLTYEFFDGKLMSIDLRVLGPRSSESLLRLLESAYGRGIRPKPMSDECFWGGHVATAHYFPLANTQVYLRVSNNELDALSQQYAKKVTQETARKL